MLVAGSSARSRAPALEPHRSLEAPMKRSVLRLMLPAMFLLPAMTTGHGGWAVITLDDLPEYAVAGTSMDLSFMVRQHGQEPMPDLKPVLVAENGTLRMKVAARPASDRGRYTASLALPSAGKWMITIHSGHGESNTTLPVMLAIDSGESQPPSWTDQQRGERLFIAKGCVTCHVEIAVAPKLGAKKYDADWLGTFLARPVRLTQAATLEMPNLGLKPAEIAALVTYINTGLGL
jgi:mono/diheme cytochrome c family protein